MAPFAAWGAGKGACPPSQGFPFCNGAFGVGLQRCQALLIPPLAWPPSCCLSRHPGSRSGGDGSHGEGSVTRVLRMLSGREQMGAGGEPSAAARKGRMGKRCRRGEGNLRIA